jgi:class 3 adenylate cyclase
MFLPNGDAAELEWLARFQREAATAEMAARLLALTYDVDVTDLLPRIRVPTVVIHRRHDRAHPFRAGRELAALLPNARFIPLEGNEHMPYLGGDDVVRAIAEFLGDPDDDVALPTEAATNPTDGATIPTGSERSAFPAQPGSLRTILFTDIEGSTALTQRLGDAGARDILRRHERIVRQQLAAHGGREIKALGDGFMASFASASGALECAIAIQQAFAAHNEQTTTPLRVRVGLNAGEPIAEESDLFGTAVNLAARVAAQAEGGQILATDVVRQLVAGKGFLFSDRGAVALRGFEDAVRLYEVSARPTA